MLEVCGAVLDRTKKFSINLLQIKTSHFHSPKIVDFFVSSFRLGRPSSLLVSLPYSEVVLQTGHLFTFERVRF